MTAIRLGFYASTISDLRAKKVECYICNETEGKYAVVEIGSTAIRYLKSVMDTM